MSRLVQELLISAAMVSTTVVVHLLGLNLLIQATRLHLARFSIHLEVDRVLVPLGMVLGMFVIHAVEIWSYAALYLAGGAVDRLDDALYLSAGSYSTAGWVDLHLPQGWRVVVSLEAVNGLLLLGWSTAFLFQNLHRLLVTEEDHPLPKGAIARKPKRDGVEKA